MTLACLVIFASTWHGDFASIWPIRNRSSQAAPCTSTAAKTSCVARTRFRPLPCVLCSNPIDDKGRTCTFSSSPFLSSSPFPIWPLSNTLRPTSDIANSFLTSSHLPSLSLVSSSAACVSSRRSISCLRFFGWLRPQPTGLPPKLIDHIDNAFLAFIFCLLRSIFKRRLHRLFSTASTPIQLPSFSLHLPRSVVYIRNIDSIPGPFQKHSSNIPQALPSFCSGRSKPSSLAHARAI